MQDIGGRNTAAVFGWGNMWGNLGAAASAVAVPRLMTLGNAEGSLFGSGQTTVFVTCASMYLVAAVAVLGTDATQPVRKPEAATTEPHSN
jgi:ACS family glucarate transporter-like MFS transporter